MKGKYEMVDIIFELKLTHCQLVFITKYNFVFNEFNFETISAS